MKINENTFLVVEMKNDENIYRCDGHLTDYLFPFETIFELMKN